MLVQTLVFLMLGSCALFGLAFPPTDLLAALPGVDGGWMVGCRAGADGVSVILERVLSPAISVRGMLATERGAQLMGRLRIPVDLSPAFYAIDIGTQGVGGWMTLLLGPVSVDLGRQWTQKRRELSLQIAVSSWMTWIVHWEGQDHDTLGPSVGWRMRLARDRFGEAGLLLGRRVTGWLAWEF